MGFGQDIAMVLPSVRRYARALTGSQTVGDDAVRRLLAAIRDGDATLTRGPGLRRELFRLLHQHGDLGTARTNANPFQLIDRRAQKLMLLTAVEGFSLTDCAEILDADAEELAGQLTNARRTVCEALRSRILIIEDEGVIALHIRQIVTEAGHQVVGMARTHDEAVQMARETQPAVILADISLADGSNGIDAVQEILRAMDVNVVFVTAFPERLLTGERVEPTYLVQKPFEPLMLTTTIAQAILTGRTLVN